MALYQERFPVETVVRPGSRDVLLKFQRTWLHHDPVDDEMVRFAGLELQARQGADLGGARVEDALPRSPTPRERDYWVTQRKRRVGEIVSSHLVKYPYSFYAVAADLRDEGLKERVLENLYHLTAVS